MTALHPTRRRLLSAVAGGAAATLAGCSSAVTDTTTKTAGDARRPLTEAITEFDVHRLRADTDSEFVGLRKDGRGHGGPTFVFDTDDADALTFDPRPDGAAAAERFVESTDFEESMVFVFENGVGDCYRTRLAYVHLKEDDIAVSGCRQLRDATVPCRAKERVYEALFVRLPNVYDEPPSGHSTTMRGSCEGVDV